MTTPAADDENALDELFAQAIDAVGHDATVDLAAWLDGREHLRERALTVLALARGVAPGRPPVPPVPGLPAVPGFTLYEEVGRGGMGIVYRARQDTLGREVALKVLAPALLASPRSRERLEREARALARLQHPNIVTVLEVFSTPSLCAYAMEWIPGRSLARAIADRDPVLDAHAVARLGATVANALAVAHATGLVHRDVKPGNVLLRADGTPVLSDFGLVMDEGHSMHTATGEFVGTAAFAAPEQLRGEHDRIGPWTDVYGLGMTLYTALTGRPPFGIASPTAVLRALEDDAVPPLRRVAPGVPRDLATVVTKAIDHEPSRRYATATALADDLQRFLAREPVLAKPAGFATRVQRWLERKPQLALAIGALMITLLVGLSVTVWLTIDLATQRTAARQAEQAARTRQREFDQLAGIVRYDQAMAASALLHPPWPDHVAAMEQWLARDAGDLLAMRPQVEATLQALYDRAAAPVPHEAAAERQAQQFLQSALTALLAKFDTLELERHAVASRLHWARGIAAWSRAHPNATTSWAEARAALAAADGVRASERYRGLALPLADADVVGLVPIGRNPATGLWEFYDLRSAWDGVQDPATLPIPTHRSRDGDAGHIAVDDTTGIVFVLVPGGTFVLGSQATDPAAPNHDPRSGPNESAHTVTLAPFFLARHELTQGQWQRLSGGATPSHFRAGDADPGGRRITAAHPVEQVDQAMAATLLAQHGMTLPTEAQWEYGCRAGTTTPWWTGRDRESLRGAANLADGTARQARMIWNEIADWPEFEDGFVVHAPVDTLRANAFGLHHVHGNVWEWCADWYSLYEVPVRPGDGLRLVPDGAGKSRVPRGGSFSNAAPAVRAAYRRDYTPVLRHQSLGVRAARSLRSGNG